MDQARKQENHVPALVHDGRVAEAAAHLAGKLVLYALLRRVVPLQVVVSVREVDVFFVEDGGPLEGCGYTIGFVSSRLSSCVQCMRAIREYAN